MQLDSMRVLIADPDRARADTLAHLLDGEPAVAFDVVRTATLEEAVESLEDEPFDAVLADLSLDDDSPLPTLAILLTHAGSAPIVVLSDRADDLIPLRALQHGADDQLPRDQLYATPVVRTIRYAVERSRTEVALRESEQRYRALFQQSRDAIFIADRDAGIQEVNRAALELFGYRVEELVGRELRSLFVDPGEYEHLSREVERTGSAREVEARLRTSDGRELWCLLATTERRAESGEPLGWLGIVHDITERKRAELRLQHDALHDPLTGLANRVLFMDRLDLAVRRSEREGEPSFGLLYLDLDRFKGVNDRLGHAAGDQVLRRTAALLRSCVRGHDTVGRFGGDEFVILLDGIEGDDDATRVADRVLELLDQPYRLGGREFFTTASIGITTSSKRRSSPDTLLREADLAMYRAKVRGGARHEWFEPEMHHAAVSQLEMESDLRRALEGDQFVLFYQPILSLDTGRTTAFEALARWRHPRRGLLAPGAFIPLAEETGLIVPLGFWALRQAARQLRDWRGSSTPEAGPTMSVNLSPRQFVEPNLVDRIRTIVEEERVPPRWIRLELTENALMQDADQAAGKLTALRDMGFGLCLDDFGTGYSSLSYLRTFPLDRLKVDRSFVGRLEESPRELELVATITDLARNLGIESIIEGVETEAQLARLRTLRPHEVQGFLFARPIEADDAARFLGTTWPGLKPAADSLAARLVRRLFTETPAGEG